MKKVTVTTLIACLLVGFVGNQQVQAKVRVRKALKKLPVHEIVIPEQRYVINEDDDDDEHTEEEHKAFNDLIKLANLVAYDAKSDSHGEHIAPTYIGHHNVQFAEHLRKKMRQEAKQELEAIGGYHTEHFYKGNHGAMRETCITDEDCNQRFFICGAEEPGICGHKDVFPTGLVETIGVFTFAFVMALCTVAGIGGGGIAISLIIAFFNFTTKQAVAISSLSILTCTTMRFIY